MRRIAPLLLCATLAGCAQPSRIADAIRVDSAVAVPMRDGVELKATVWRPASGERVPVLITRTPYGRGEAAARDFVSQAVRRGYAVVVQDVRGRYESDGEFEPYRHEGQDGYDTIEWAARQPWSNGVVGSFGLSYPGRGAVARRGRDATLAQGDGAGDDLRHAGNASGIPAACGTVPGSTGPGGTSRPICGAGSTGRARAPIAKSPPRGSRAAPRQSVTGRCSRCPTSRMSRRGTTSGCAILRAIRGGAGPR